MESGIYRIQHKESGKVYIGQSRRVGCRLNAHKCRLRAQQHKNRHLQAAFNKCGEDAFTWELLETVALDNLSPREAFWIAHFDSANRLKGYNITFVDPAGVVINAPNTGKKASEHTKRLMSAVRKGKPKGEAHKRAIAQANCKKLWHFVNEQTGEIILEGNIQAIAKARGLSAGALHSLSTGKLKQYRGWTIPAATINGQN